MAYSGSLWTLGIPTMFNIAGKSCQTTITGTGTISFSGILDQAELVDETPMGDVVRMQSVLRVGRDVGKQLKGITNHPVTIGGIDYIANEPIAEDDGETFLMPIYPADNDERYGW